MAIGFPPQYSIIFPLGPLSPAEFLMLAIDAAYDMGWEIIYKDENGFLAGTDKGLFPGHSEVVVKVEGRVAELKSFSTGNELTDLDRNKKNITEFITIFNNLKSVATKAELAGKYEAFVPDVALPGNNFLDRPSLRANDKIKSFFFLLVPRKGYFITPILVGLNSFVLLLMVKSGVPFFFPDKASLIQWGANFKPLTLDGEWWRLIVSSFLHFGFVHFFINMITLIIIGVLLEPYLGAIRFLAAYLLTGLMAAITSLWWHDLTVSAGASGAIFGMYGVFIALLTTNFIEKKTRKPLLISIAFFVIYNLLYGSTHGAIDNAAHVGGLLCGLIAGYAFYPSLKRPHRPGLKYITTGLFSLLILSASFLIFHKIPDDIVQYEQAMKKFAAWEFIALQALQLPANTSADIKLGALKNSGIYYWDQNIGLLEKADRLNIPERLHERDKKLIQYCKLRKASYQLIYKSIIENTDQYGERILNYKLQIQHLMINLSE